MKDEMINELSKLDRQRMHRIWGIVKKGNLDVLSGEEKRLGEVMLEHEDQYANQFEMADILGDQEFAPGSEEDPFIHVAFHTIVENQLESKDPIETYQFYNAMRKKKVSRHDAIHLIAAILTPLIVSTLQQNEAFDLKKYKSLLKRCKGKKPHRIFQFLDKDVDSLLHT
jgi:hypothetical protein